MAIGLACNKALRKKKFILPDRIDIIPSGSYTDNRKQSKKAIDWLKLEEKKEGKRNLHRRNVKERHLP